MKKTKTLTEKDISIPMFTATLFTIAKMEKWIKKMRACVRMHTHTNTQTYTHSGTLYSHKKRKIFSFATTQMNLEGIRLK